MPSTQQEAIHQLTLSPYLKEEEGEECNHFPRVIFVKNSIRKNILVILTSPRILMYGCVQDKDLKLKMFGCVCTFHSK